MWTRLLIRTLLSEGGRDRGREPEAVNTRDGGQFNDVSRESGSLMEIRDSSPAEHPRTTVIDSWRLQIGSHWQAGMRENECEKITKSEWEEGGEESEQRADG